MALDEDVMVELDDEDDEDADEEEPAEVVEVTPLLAED